MHSSVLLFLSNLFSSDMLIILFVALMLFGGEKLPEIARGLGKGIRDFKDASEGVKREINNQINSYEEKRAEETINKQAEAIRNQLPENTNPSIETHPYVENTIPVNENYFNGNESHVTTDDHAGGYNELASENHAAAQHSNAGATNNEPTKKS